MEHKARRTLAVTAGLTALLALSPVALPVATALAEEGAAPADPTAEAQASEDRSFLVWHYGNSEDLHLYVDLFRPRGVCDRCGAPYWDGCEPGGDEDPEQQEGFVTFQCTDPESGASTFEDEFGPIVDGKMTISEVPAPTEYEGYDFVGWSVCGGEPVSAKQLVGTQVSPYTVIKAVYEPSAPVTVTHNVTFDDQVESTDNIVVKVEHGETVARPSEDPTLDDHTFGGWYTEPECLTEYVFATPVTSDITLYAKWVPIEEPTDPEEPGTDPEEPTDPEVPTDPEEPTDPDQPGDAAGQPGDDAPTAPSSDDAAKNAGSKGDELPQTGDATVAVSGIAVLGAATVGLGAFLRRRR